MRAYVITLADVMQSVEATQRCFVSAAEFGIAVTMTQAFTALDRPAEIFTEREWNPDGFTGNTYSRLEPCMATFLSHAGLWRLSMLSQEPILILEHDAIFKAPLPDLSDFKGCCNLGKPSFGQYKTPQDGFGPLASKDFMPGAHAYYVTPDAAQELLEKAKTEACPTDVFLSLARFPWLTEYHPWPVVCEDSFSTIQKAKGCKAKHRDVEVI